MSLRHPAEEFVRFGGHGTLEKKILQPKIPGLVGRPPVPGVDRETPIARLVIGAMRGALKMGQEID